MQTITTLEGNTYQIPDEVFEILEEGNFKIVYQCAHPNVSSGKPFYGRFKWNNGTHIELRGNDVEARWLEFYTYGSMTPKVYRITKSVK